MNIIEKFTTVCKSVGGKLSTALGRRYCLIPKEEFNPILLAIDTTSPKPFIDISTGYSYIELYNVKDISKTNHLINVETERGFSKVDTEIGTIKFYGHIKGKICCCKEER